MTVQDATLTDQSTGSEVRPEGAVILFGAPGSGKGTQARLLANCLKIPQISTGEMLREQMRRGASMPESLESAMQAGLLVSDEVINQMINERLREPDCRRGFILDGYPRTLAQGGYLLEWLDGHGMDAVVIHLAVDYNIIITRLTGRRQCPRCGTVYNVFSDPPQVDELCDVDGTPLVVRPDDQESVIRQRLEEYEKRTRPLLDFFRGRGREVWELDASHQTPDTLFRKICRSIKDR